MRLAWRSGSLELALRTRSQEMSAPPNAPVELHAAIFHEYENGAIGVLSGGSARLGTNDNRHAIQVRAIDSTDQFLVDIERKRSGCIGTISGGGSYSGGRRRSRRTWSNRHCSRRSSRRPLRPSVAAELLRPCGGGAHPRVRKCGVGQARTPRPLTSAAARLSAQWQPPKVHKDEHPGE